MKEVKLEELESFSKSVLEELLSKKEESRPVFVGLAGDLGAGKTAFVKAIGKNLGISDEIISPTFIIERVYPVSDNEKIENLIHIDAYRFESEDEAKCLPLKELLENPKNLIFLEWPSVIEGVLPKHNKISFKIINENTRAIEISYV